jgi:hypothetical protein
MTLLFHARNSVLPNEPKTTIVCNNAAQAEPTAPTHRPSQKIGPNEPISHIACIKITQGQSHYRTHNEPRPQTRPPLAAKNREPSTPDRDQPQTPYGTRVQLRRKLSRGMITLAEMALKASPDAVGKRIASHTPPLPSPTHPARPLQTLAEKGASVKITEKDVRYVAALANLMTSNHNAHALPLNLRHAAVSPALPILTFSRK